MLSSSALLNTGFTLSWKTRRQKGKDKEEVELSCDSGLLSGLQDPYQVDVTELVQPEVVDGGGDGREVVGLEAGVTECNSGAQPGQNPPVRYALLSR